MAAGFLSRLLGSKPTPPELKLLEFRSLDEYRTFQQEHREELDAEFMKEVALIPKIEPFTINAYCYVCQKPSVFDVDFAWPRQVRGHTVPAWRESTVCRSCKLSNRLRADVHLLDLHAHLQPGDKLYLTEQNSQLFKVMKERQKTVEGSEFLGDTVPFGTKNSAGTRNEDLTKLTFKDSEFKAAMCFEVMEHVPNYRKGIAELFRVLQPGGTLVLSLPFVPGRQEHLVRARVKEDGSIEHLTEPEYHFDPLDPKGCLCFYHFGWDILNDLQDAGFQDPHVVYYASREYGYLGHDPTQFIATKPVA